MASWWSERRSIRRTPMAGCPQTARASHLCVTHPFQNRDLANLGWLKMIPKDAAGSLILALHIDHCPRGGDQIDRQVVCGHHQMPPQDLSWVHGRCHRRMVINLACVDQDSILQVRIAAAFAD